MYRREREFAEMSDRGHRADAIAISRRNIVVSYEKYTFVISRYSCELFSELLKVLANLLIYEHG